MAISGPTPVGVQPSRATDQSAPTHSTRQIQATGIDPREVDRLESQNQHPPTQPKKKGIFARLVAAIGSFFRSIFSVFTGRRGREETSTTARSEQPTTTRPARRGSTEQPPVRVATAEALAAPGSAAATDPGKRGPYGVDKKRIDIEMPDGRINKAYVYMPRGKGPFAPAIYTSGLMGHQSHGTGTATQLASWGMVTIVPDIGINGSPPRSADTVRGVIDWLHADNELSSKLRLDRGVGLIGHSFGGLTAILAGNDPRVGAVVALDPNDDSGRDGAENAHRVTAPVAVLRGEFSLGNTMAQGIVDRLPRGKQHYKIPGAHHFDFMSTSSRGFKNDENRIAMRFATAFMLSKLLGRSDMDSYTGAGARVQAAARRGELEILATR
jgi:dienelactone hydrolase